jgi:menaquinone-dependent protoporphyrinogen oxidase
MSASVLVAYATRYGSTHEVAEAVAATLRAAALDVELQPMRKVRSLQGYRAVVLGAPIYLSLWHKDAHHFLIEHRMALTERPVAVFALGPLTTDGKEMRGSRLQLNKELAKYSWLNPVAVEIFIGKYDPAKLHLPDKFVAAFPASPLKGMPLTDARDWAAIHAWASTLPGMLHLFDQNP